LSVAADCLRFCRDDPPKLQGQVVSHVNVSWVQASVLLAELVGSGLMRYASLGEGKSGFVASEAGLKFLARYDELAEDFISQQTNKEKV
jgi:predicted transcriptional regulator